MVPSDLLLFVFLLWWFSIVSVSHAQTNGQVRLVNGSQSTEGRVEIFYNRTWGTVCDDSWDVNDAVVVCRQLNYYTECPKAFSNARFGQGAAGTQIWLDDVRCNGNETQLLNCGASPIGTHNCVHGEDAGVFCFESKGVASRPSHNCSGILYIPENGPVYCTCSTERLMSNGERLIWKLGSYVIATSYYARELRFPSSHVTRRDDGKMATCVLERTEPHSIDFTNRIAYGPDAVDISFAELFDVHGNVHVIVTCRVTGMSPLEVTMVRWLGLCQGQTGFTCTLTSPVTGQGVTCTVTNTANNNSTRQASAVLQLLGYRPVGQLRHNCSEMGYLPETGPVPCACTAENLGSPPGRLLWLLGNATIATGQTGVGELDFPSGHVTRDNDGQTATCRLEWRNQQNITMTSRVAYGPDDVNLSIDQLYDVNGASHVILTCKVTGMYPVEGSVLQWSVPCHDQTGFSCTLTSPVTGQSVTCTVTNTANNNSTRQASAVLQLLGYRPVAAESSPYNLSTTVGPAAAAGGLFIAFLVVTIVLIVYRHRNASNAVREEEREPRMHTELNVYESLHAHQPGPATATATATAPTSQKGGKVQTSASSDHVYANSAFDTGVDHIYANT